MSTDANANFQQMLNATKLGDSGGPADSLEKVAENTLNDMVAGASKLFGLSFISKLLGQGLTKSYETEGWAAKKMNPGAGTLGTGSGKLSALLDQLGLVPGKIGDFSKLVASAVDPMQHLAAEMHASHISMGDGTPVQPLETGGFRSGGGINMNI